MNSQIRHQNIVVTQHFSLRTDHTFDVKLSTSPRLPSACAKHPLRQHLSCARHSKTHACLDAHAHKHCHNQCFFRCHYLFSSPSYSVRKSKDLVLIPFSFFYSFSFSFRLSIIMHFRSRSRSRFRSLYLSLQLHLVFCRVVNQN
jgi:hypothetical protein